jgi:exopolysaccharide production protein ExoQ
MPRNIALGLALIGIYWLLLRDRKDRSVLSAATWVPSVWLMLLSSRPASTWFSESDPLARGSEYSLEGSPVDRLVYLALILLGFWILSKRSMDWGALFRDNKALFTLYGFFALSILWASAPIVSGKRWVKDLGNVVMALVILTDAKPLEALRAIFVRAAYVLIPLSAVVLRYFPEIGRTYNKWTGNMEAVGLTFQKNSLGAQVLVAGIILVWDTVLRFKEGSISGRKIALLTRGAVLFVGAYLLKVSDSKTATLCLFLGSILIISARSDLIRRSTAKILPCGAMFLVLGVLGDRLFGISELLVSSMGRDMTFTGRTNIWQELLNLQINPILGTGFLNIWSDARYLDTLPGFATHSAHNGYLEIYLDGGLIAVLLFTVMLFSILFKLHRELQTGEEYPIARFAIIVIALIYNLSESNFFRMTPVWFLFLVVSINYTAGRIGISSSTRARSFPMGSVVI